MEYNLAIPNKVSDILDLKSKINNHVIGKALGIGLLNIINLDKEIYFPEIILDENPFTGDEYYFLVIYLENNPTKNQIKEVCPVFDIENSFVYDNIKQSSREIPD